MPSLVVTVIGTDRPGLVGTVSDVVKQHGGNWLQSRMAHLAGKFAGIVQVDASEVDCQKLVTALEGLESQGLRVVAEVDSSSADSATAGEVWQLSVTGNDRPGIVREVTQVLAGHDVNVEELITECADAPVAGGKIFKADAHVQIPNGMDVEMLQKELERIGPELMIDLSRSSE